MTKLKPWYNILVIVGLLGVILGPWLFTRPYLCGWSCFDFSQTGQIIRQFNKLSDNLVCKLVKPCYKKVVKK